MKHSKLSLNSMAALLLAILGAIVLTGLIYMIICLIAIVVQPLIVCGVFVVCAFILYQMIND